MEFFPQIVHQMHSMHIDLLQHSVYTKVHDLRSLQIFMESHVFAVWDFMTLLKTLQKRLTCVEIPWFPVQDSMAARLINEIVLAEESDEITPGYYSSHFDLYLKAMKEIGANIRPIRNFIGMLEKGIYPKQALSALKIPDSTKTFVLTTLEISNRSTHEVAAAFLFGREEIIPHMFRKILIELEKKHRKLYKWFPLYLNRHIELDETQHAPMAKKLLENLCGTDPKKWKQAFHAAKLAANARFSLWDGIVKVGDKIKE